MLGSFKVRMLVVVVIATLAGLAMQSDNRSHDLVRPVISFVLRDYQVEEKVAVYLENLRQEKQEELPVSGDATLQQPCEFIEVEHFYGWYWDAGEGKQEFFPGVSLKVKENTLVRPVMAGKVVSISGGGKKRTIRIQHNEDFASLYQGLQEVLVEENQVVDKGQALGKAGKSLYLELHNLEGPVSPNALFE